MGERLVLRLFKGGSTADFCSFAEQAAVLQGGRLRWGTPGTGIEELRYWSDGLHHAIHIPGQAGYCLAVAVGKLSQLPWFELRIQEGSLWDYSLYQGDQHVDNFSTWPEYWEDPKDPGFEEFKKKNLGDSETVARVWSIPAARISRYLKQWGHVPDADDESVIRHVLKGKAYPSDRFEYGDIWQLYDFLNALGGREPFNGYESHCLEIPKR